MDQPNVEQTDISENIKEISEEIGEFKIDIMVANKQLIIMLDRSLRIMEMLIATRFKHIE